MVIEQGMVDEARKALEEAEALEKLPARQEPVLDSSKYTAVDVRLTDQKLRVCDICGAFLSVYDSDRRLADHFGGKLHLGYMQIREKLAELQAEKNKIARLIGMMKEDQIKERSKERDREPSRDRERGIAVTGRGRDLDRRSRDSDRYYDHDRGERDRDSNRSRNHESRSHRRSRSRSPERSKHYDLHRRYD